MAKFKLKPTPLLQGLPVKLGSLKLDLIDTPRLSVLHLTKDTPSAYKVDIGEVKETKEGRLAWFAQNQALLFGQIDTDNFPHQADVSDGWVFMSLSGEGCEDVMARLVPLDLRRHKITPNQSFRTQLKQLQALIIISDQGYEIGVMSSFAHTAKHELLKAMESVHALST